MTKYKSNRNSLSRSQKMSPYFLLQVEAAEAAEAEAVVVAVAAEEVGP